MKNRLKSRKWAGRSIICLIILLFVFLVCGVATAEASSGDSAGLLSKAATAKPTKAPTAAPEKLKFDTNKECIKGINKKMEYCTDYNSATKEGSWAPVPGSSLMVDMDALTSKVTYTFRVAEVAGKSAAGLPGHISIDPRPVFTEKQIEGFEIDYNEQVITNSTKLRIDDKFEYKVGTKKWAKAKKFVGNDLDISKFAPKSGSVEIKIRLACTDKLAHGVEYNVGTLKAAPAKPEKALVKIDFENEEILGMADKEWSVDKGRTWYDYDIGGDGELPLTGKELAPLNKGAITVYVRWAADTDKNKECFPSKPISIKIPARPKAPTPKYDYNKEELKSIKAEQAYFVDDKVLSKYEYDEDDFTDINDTTVIKPLAKDYKVKVVTKATAKAFRSQVGEVTIGHRAILDIKKAAPINYSGETIKSSSAYQYLIVDKGELVNTESTGWKNFSSATISIKDCIPGFGENQVPIAADGDDDDKIEELIEPGTFFISRVDEEDSPSYSKDIYIRTKATASVAASYPERLVISSRPKMSSGSLDYNNYDMDNEIVTLIITGNEKLEYSTGSAYKDVIVNSDDGGIQTGTIKLADILSTSAPVTLSVRIKSIDTTAVKSFGSEPTTLNFTKRPTKPSVTLDYGTGIFHLDNQEYDDGMKCRVDEKRGSLVTEGKWSKVLSGITEGVSVPLEPCSYPRIFRFVKMGNDRNDDGTITPNSVQTVISIGQQSEPPTISIDYENEVFKNFSYSTMEYSTDEGASWISGVDTNKIPIPGPSSLDLTERYIFRYKATSSSLASKVTPIAAALKVPQRRYPPAIKLASGSSNNGLVYYVSALPSIPNDTTVVGNLSDVEHRLTSSVSWTKKLSDTTLPALYNGSQTVSFRLSATQNDFCSSEITITYTAWSITVATN